MKDEKHMYYTALYAIKLGYTGIVWNHSVDASTSKKLNKQQHSNRIQYIDITSKDIQNDGISSRHRYTQQHENSNQSPIIQQKSRLTYIIDDINQLQQLNPASNSSVVNTYDIIAVYPMNEKSFIASCACDYIDLIYIECHTKLSYYIKRPQVHMAIERGILFEVQYSHALMDTSARKYFIYTTLSILRMTNGKNMCITSGTQSMYTLRSMSDIVNIMLMAGVNRDICRYILQRQIESLFIHAETRRKTIKSVIREAT
jgi:RNase P/RNase MRP subunit p30